MMTTSSLESAECSSVDENSHRLLQLFDSNERCAISDAARLLADFLANEVVGLSIKVTVVAAPETIPTCSASAIHQKEGNREEAGESGVAFKLLGRDGRLLASTIHKAYQWFGFRLIATESSQTVAGEVSSSSSSIKMLIVKSLFGCNKEEQISISRYMKLVESWHPDWHRCSQRSYNFDLDMSDPYSHIHLLENSLRHQRIRHITMYNHKKRTAASGAAIDGIDRVTIADILLFYTLRYWMVGHEPFRDVITRSLPAIVAYTCRIREELIGIFTSLLSPSSMADLMSDLLAKKWMDDDITSSIIESAKVGQFAFKFASFSTVPSNEDGKFRRINRNVMKSGNNQSFTEIEHAYDDKILTSLDTLVKEWRLCSVESKDSNEGISNISADNIDKKHSIIPCDDGDELLFSEEFWNLLKVPTRRSERKQQQIRSLVKHSLSLLPPRRVSEENEYTRSSSVAATATAASSGGDINVVNEDIYVVEFCSGGGYIGLAIAYLRPDVTVILTDMNAISLKFAEKRAENMKISNVRFCRCEMEHLIRNRSSGLASTQATKSAHLNSFADPNPSSSLNTSSKIITANEFPNRFHLGISLHACGSATDAVLKLCFDAQSSFVVTPCCYGSVRWSPANPVTGGVGSVEKIASCVPCADTNLTNIHQSAAPPTPGLAVQEEDLRFGSLSYPQSKSFLDLGWQANWFSGLCSRADRTFWEHDSRSLEHNASGIAAMRAVDSDRILLAREKGYLSARPYTFPSFASTKNHILVGSLS